MNRKFIDTVADNYDAIKARFKAWTGLNNMGFDEDVFHDTILKCGETFAREDASKEVCLQYLWKSYKNNLVRETQYSRNRNRESLDGAENAPCEDSTFTGELLSKLTEAFSEEDMDLFFDYINKDIPQDIPNRNEVLSKAKRIKNKIKKKVTACLSHVSGIRLA